MGNPTLGLKIHPFAGVPSGGYSQSGPSPCGANNTGTVSLVRKPETTLDLPGKKPYLPGPDIKKLEIT